MPDLPAFAIKKSMQCIEILRCTEMASPFDKQVWGSVEAKFAVKEVAPSLCRAATPIGVTRIMTLAAPAL